MIRIGIIGSDNSHADRYAELCNLPDDPRFKQTHVAEAKVVALFGIPEHAERTKEVSTKNRIPTVVSSPEELIGKIDLAICVFRKGSLHAKYSLPIVAAGIPIYVDKPFASNVADARAMLAAADKRGTPITTFSSFRVAQSTLQFKAELEKIGPVTYGISLGPGDRKSEYDGLIFYGIHAVEVMLAVFGHGVRDVRAVDQNNNIVATVTYPDDRIVTLVFIGNAKYAFRAIAFGKKGEATFTPGTGTYYRDALMAVIEMAKTRKRPLTNEQMLEQVQIFHAIEQSLQNGGAPARPKDF
jgi:predicted dehydrogenase